MTKKYAVLLLVIAVAVLCLFAVAVMGEVPRPLPPLTPLMTSLFFFGFTPPSSDRAALEIQNAPSPYWHLRAKLWQISCLPEGSVITQDE